mgnify:CR=1 FL=1
MINQMAMMNYILAMHPNQPIDAEVLKYLQEGFKSYIYDKKTLDEAFHFKQARIRSKCLLDERNRYLWLAGKYYIEHKSPSDLARKLEKEIHRFESTQWLLWKNLDNPPEGCSFLRWHLFHAKKTGLDMPGFRQIIRDVIRTKSP